MDQFPIPEELYHFCLLPFLTGPDVTRLSQTSWAMYWILWNKVGTYTYEFELTESMYDPGEIEDDFTVLTKYDNLCNTCNINISTKEEMCTNCKLDEAMYSMGLDYDKECREEEERYLEDQDYWEQDDHYDDAGDW
jgi:hypothetical protein